MSQTQVQLVGNVVTGAVFSGIVTANTSVNIADTVGINSSGINVSGAITATTFYGDGSGLTGVGVGTEDSINTTGIITATKISAQEFEGFGDNLIFSPTITSFSPTDGETGVSALNSPDISITYNQSILLGTGTTITLRKSSASGDIVESYEVGVSTRATVSNQTLTVDPTNNFDYNQEYYLVVPQGSITNYVGGNGSLLDTYNFTTEAGPVVTSFNPLDEETDVAVASNIVVTFDKDIRAGVGTITLREGSAGGTITESYDVSSSGRLTFSTNTLTIDPTSDLTVGTTYYVVIPNNAVAGYAGTDTYNFTSINITYPLFSWGQNSRGQLGQGNQTQYSSPVQIPGTTWSSIESGSILHTLATKTDGTLWSWGYNGFGELGQNNRTEYSSPVQIPGTSWSSVSGGAQHTLATKTDGTLWSWGRNNRGVLGQSNATNYSSPVQIPGTQWSSIGGGAYHALVIKTDGTLWAWGANDAGRLGQNNTTYYSSPVQIPGTQWSSVSGGSNNNWSAATKTDGTLWTWGSNYFGQLGQNNRTNYSSPRQVPGTQWSSIGNNGYSLLATKTDGTLWACGLNSNGQLGQGNLTQYSSPRQIPGNTWSSVSGGYEHVLATKTDGTLWAWGDNNNGNLGQSNRSYSPSPIQIPGTQWSSISAGNDSSFAIQSV